MSLLKLAAPGFGFSRLQALGLGEKTLQSYAGSNWLKNAAPKKEVIKSIPKVISKQVYDQGLAKIGNIEGGPQSNLPNAWKAKKGMGPNSNIPLATGLFKQALEIPISHLTGDTKEINEMRGLAKKIVKITKEMNSEDKQAMK